MPSRRTLMACSSRSSPRTWQAGMFARACGSEAQVVALAGSWISGLVRDRARAAALQLDLCLVPGFGLMAGFGFGLGFPLDPRGVLAAGLPFGLLCREALCSLARPR